jgi:hypothetical protein
LFPNLIAHHVYRGEPIPLPDGRPYDYLLAGNGLFIRAATRFWNGRLPVASFIVRGLPPLPPSFHLKTARLSNKLLCEFIRHARQRRGRPSQRQRPSQRGRPSAQILVGNLTGPG